MQGFKSFFMHKLYPHAYHAVKFCVDNVEDPKDMSIYCDTCNKVILKENDFYQECEDYYCKLTGDTMKQLFLGQEIEDEDTDKQEH